MADINIRISQSVADSNWQLEATDAGGLIEGLLRGVADAAPGAQENSLDAQVVLQGDTLRLNFPDGAYDEFTGLTVQYTQPLVGTAVATGVNLYLPQEAAATQTGSYGFSFDLRPGQVTLASTSSLTNHMTVRLDIPATDPAYDQLLGNGALELDGAFTVDAGGNLGGYLSSVKLTADKLLASASITGKYNLSGNAGGLDGSGALPGVDGTLNGVDVRFKDGSLVTATGLAVHVSAASVADPLGVLAQTALAGTDTIRVELPARMAETYTVSSGAGNDAITLGGGGGRLNAAAGAGDDIVTILSDSHQVDGGAGVDTLGFSGARGAYQVGNSAAGITVGGDGGQTVAVNVERVQFSDVAVGYDIDGNGGKAYRIYQAAFDRKPDSAGLGYWVKSLDSHASLLDVADSFIRSKEFADLYGANASNETFVARLYTNVLHRPYEQAGFNYWVDVLNKGEARAAVLANFSEGAENQAQVLGSIQNGFEFTPFS